jgi:hypothetical protein
MLNLFQHPPGGRALPNGSYNSGSYSLPTSLSGLVFS